MKNAKRRWSLTERCSAGALLWWEMLHLERIIDEDVKPWCIIRWWANECYRQISSCCWMYRRSRINRSLHPPVARQLFSLFVDRVKTNWGWFNQKRSTFPANEADIVPVKSNVTHQLPLVASSCRHWHLIVSHSKSSCCCKILKVCNHNPGLRGDKIAWIFGGESFARLLFETEVAVIPPHVKWGCPLIICL